MLFFCRKKPEILQFSHFGVLSNFPEKFGYWPQRGGIANAHLGGILFLAAH